MKHLTENFITLLNADELTSWELQEQVSRLTGCPEQVRQEILRQAAIIYPVSHALCRSFLDQALRGAACLPLTSLPEWVSAILQVYEKEGLQQASRFMAEVESNFLCRLQGQHGLTLEEAAGRLLPYLKGLAGRDLTLATAIVPYTDGQTIFLPAEMSLFREPHLNFLAYKLLATLQWGWLVGGTFQVRLAVYPVLKETLIRRYGCPWQEEKPFPTDFCGLFPEPSLAADLFELLETVRVLHLLQHHLPGLMRDSIPIRRRLRAQRLDLGKLSGKNWLLEALRHWALDHHARGKGSTMETAAFDRAIPLLFEAEAGGAADSMALTISLYELLEEFPGAYDSTAASPLLGRLDPAAVHAARLRRRQEAAQQFIKAVAAILPPQVSGPGASPEENPGRLAAAWPSEGTAMLSPAGSHREAKEETATADSGKSEPEYLVIAGQELRMPDHLQTLAREIRADLGGIPARYISAALQRAGTGMAGGPGPSGAEGEAASGPLVYDEWDYRRAGFRKNWCQLVEKEVRPVRSTFVESTLAKYRGQLRQLRRQFESMRLQQRFLKRQKEGDEIDLDAVMEALVDRRAGCPPSENLFIRLDRDERNIAAVFLVDMSSSTEGWVSTAIKEALTLMCEALEVVGDRYAIYGFSGMRRLRSELFHIKRLDEPYTQEIRERIAAITPRDYTRMGPPIRHLTRMLATTEARVRLLISLSDGKPEDYDDYKGEYAIEDTRHALIEAKAAAIHPFCITIDRQSHSYIPHMYGEVNYCFIDDVKMLPIRMPGIYRSLTS